MTVNVNVYFWALDSTPFTYPSLPYTRTTLPGLLWLSINFSSSVL